MNPRFLRRVLTMLVSAIILLCSCDLLRPCAFEVLSWSPGVDRVDPDAVSATELRLLFSNDADPVSVERAFTLEEEDRQIRGSFVWETPRIVRFLPYVPLRENSGYRISVAASASDRTGVSLDEEFQALFQTRESTVRPRPLSIRPADGETVEDDRPPIEIEFASPVEAAACRDHVTLDPSVPGVWTIDESGLFARFVPLEALKEGIDCLVEVSADLPGRNGLRAGAGLRSRFSIGADRTAPVFLEATAVDENGIVRATLLPDRADDASRTENARWETSWRLRLVFSEEVELRELDLLLDAVGGPALQRATTGDRSAEAVYRTVEAPTWGDRFSFLLESGVPDGHGNSSDNAYLFRIVADGPASRPPILVGARFPLLPGGTDAASCEAVAFPVEEPFAALAIEDEDERYPFDTATATRVELYFKLADGAVPDAFSLMENFRVEATGGALSFSPREVKTTDFYLSDPPCEWAEYTRVEVEGYLTNRPESGVVSFVIGAGFRDSLGNQTRAASILPLLK